MIVYGDHARRRRTDDVLDAIADAIERLDEGPGGIGRHARLVAVLIQAGELAQGIADAEFTARGGRDARSAAADAAIALASALAAWAERSWRDDFEAESDAPAAALADLRRIVLPPEITVKTAEGFAFYALYPEAYAEAAQALAGREVRVLGLRSIGTTLAAMTAASAGAPSPLSMRPVGHPFARELALDPALQAELAASAERETAVVDEGPGLSGSSMAAVVRTLEGLGHDRTRIHLLPGHGGGPGPQAGPAVRAVWSDCAVHVATFEATILNATDPRRRLSTWVGDLVGPLVRPLRDVAGGGWRELRYPDEASWPPVHPWQERRKFLADTTDGTWLVKFAGLGRRGEEALARARRLAAAGMSPEPAGLLHGFLVERWRDDSRPLDLATADRARLVGRLGTYLALRARAFPSAHTGASPGELLAMARHNAGAVLGPETDRALARWAPDLPELAAQIRPVETDSRLHAWEWLESGDGLIKTDAVDHHAGHDLVGCQDIAWDVAGGVVEFGLDPDEAQALAAVMAADGVRTDPDLVAFFVLCYAAFQLGAWTMAGDAAAPAEARRIGAAVTRYREALSARLEH